VSRVVSATLKSQAARSVLKRWRKRIYFRE